MNQLINLNPMILEECVKHFFFLAQTCRYLDKMCQVWYNDNR